MKPILVKIGGSLMENRETIEELCGALAKFHRQHPQLILCHGGGKDITRNLQWLGETPKFKDGLRITSPKAMTLVEMTLSGSVNKNLVSLLQKHGIQACGISGVDGEILVCRPQDPELGQVGVVEKVNTRLIDILLQSHFLPVISPVSADADQTHYNVNADDAASALAVALKVSKLLFISDVPGVLDASTRIIPRLNQSGFETLVAKGIATGGIIPKLRSCLQAVSAGVDEVHICGFENAEMLLGQLEGLTTTGTVVTPT